MAPVSYRVYQGEELRTAKLRPAFRRDAPSIAPNGRMTPVQAVRWVAVGAGVGALALAVALVLAPAPSEAPHAAGDGRVAMSMRARPPITAPGMVGGPRVPALAATPTDFELPADDPPSAGAVHPPRAVAPAERRARPARARIVRNAPF